MSKLLSSVRIYRSNEAATSRHHHLAPPSLLLVKLRSTQEPAGDHVFFPQILWSIGGGGSSKGRGFELKRAERELDLVGDGPWRWRQPEGETAAALEVPRSLRPSFTCDKPDCTEVVDLHGMAAVRARWVASGRSFWAGA